MAHMTGIQWCHDTVNPVQGCDGCPLWPSYETLLARTTELLHQQAPDFPRVALKKKLLGIIRDNVLRTKRTAIMAAIDGTLRDVAITSAARSSLQRTIGREFRCYAGNMSQRFAGTNPGYAKNFDVPQMFPGRVREHARKGYPTSAEIRDKPWLAGLRRLVFVSDMGDALSESISFEYLEREIIDAVTTLQGQRHIWLWLTKRPRRMAAFYAWLRDHGSGWPDNLVPMCSILRQGNAREAEHLLEIPAMARGFSLEPIDSPITLPKSLLGRKSWVIVGGESGPAASQHSFPIELAYKLRDQCAATKTPFFLKQLGTVATRGGVRFSTKDRHGGDPSEWPVELRIREFPAGFHRNRGIAPETAA